MLRENLYTCPLARTQSLLAVSYGGCTEYPGCGATASLAKDKIESVLPSPPSDFSIDKAEGQQSDDVYVIYVRKDRHLTEVTASVTIHYVTGGRSVVAQSWSKWLGGEKKTFSNSGFRNGRIKKVRLSGIAKEHSFKDGKETVKMVTLTESKSF